MTLADAQTAYEEAIDTALGQTDEDLTAAEEALETAESGLTDAQNAVTDAEANAAAAQAAYAAAAAADDGSPTAAQYKAAFVADIQFDYDMLEDSVKTGDGAGNLGRVAYAENAAMAGLGASAQEDWDDLPDGAIDDDGSKLAKVMSLTPGDPLSLILPT